MTKIKRIEECAKCPHCAQRKINGTDIEVSCWITDRRLFVYRHGAHDEMCAGFEAMGGKPPDWCPLEDDPTPGFVDALRPFVHLADVMQPGDVLVYAGVCVTYEDVLAAKAAHEKAQG